MKQYCASASLGLYQIQHPCLSWSCLRHFPPPAYLRSMHQDPTQIPFLSCTSLALPPAVLPGLPLLWELFSSTALHSRGLSALTAMRMSGLFAWTIRPASPGLWAFVEPQCREQSPVNNSRCIPRPHDSLWVAAAACSKRTLVTAYCLGSVQRPVCLSLGHLSKTEGVVLCCDLRIAACLVAEGTCGVRRRELLSQVWGQLPALRPRNWRLDAGSLLGSELR